MDTPHPQKSMRVRACVRACVRVRVRARARAYVCASPFGDSVHSNAVFPSCVAHQSPSKELNLMSFWSKTLNNIQFNFGAKPYVNFQPLRNTTSKRSSTKSMGDHSCEERLGTLSKTAEDSEKNVGKTVRLMTQDKKHT